MLKAIEELAMDALFLERSDYTHDHAVLLGAMRSDELLFQPIAAQQGGLSPTGEDEAILRHQTELAHDLSQGDELADQGMLKGAGGSRSLARSGQMPAQKFADAAIDGEG